MNKLRLNYKTCLILALILSVSASAFSQVSNSIAADSLKIDDSEIKDRRFEDLKEKYSSDDFIYERTVETSGWWTRFKQWLSDFIKDLFNFENRREAEKAVDILIKTLGVILFILVIYFIVKAILNKEGQWVFGKSSDKSIIRINDLEANIQVVDLKKLIREAEQQNNFRLAIRYYYLLLLKMLNKQGLISYDVEKTNSDYYEEISSSGFRSDFSYASYLYNYIWYGEFDVDQNQFERAKQAFNRFIAALGS
ncbi:MAG: DUF4129 domain-containing protein [Flavobacteriaceae bacterium]|nr:DUF4129 domain-containing protein [Flavobacteriaceae bacterium]